MIVNDKLFVHKRGYLVNVKLPTNIISVLIMNKTLTAHGIFSVMETPLTIRTRDQRYMQSRT
jgi:hypothetical protein